MKILVNSKYIAGAFKKAIELHSEEVQISDRNKIMFSGGEEKHFYVVHILEQSESVYLERVSLYKAYKFIKALEEQPIVLEMGFDDIEVSQFVKSFRHNKV